MAKHRLELQVQGWRGWAKPRKQPWRGAGRAVTHKHPRPGLQEAKEHGTLCPSTPPAQQTAACWCYQHCRVATLPRTPPGLPQPPPNLPGADFFLSVTPSERHWGRARNTSNTRPPTSLAYPWEKMAVGHGLLVPHAARAPRTAGKVQGKCCARPCPTLQACPSQAEHGTAAPFPFSPRYPSSWDVIFSPLKR